MKQIQVQLYPPEQPYWHGDIKEHWHSSGVFIVNFEKNPHLSLVFHCWIWKSVASCIYQQRPNQKIRNHASTGTNYAKLTKQEQKKKPTLNLNCMLIVGFESTSTKFIEIFVL